MALLRWKTLGFAQSWKYNENNKKNNIKNHSWHVGSMYISYIYIYIHPICTHYKYHNNIIYVHIIYIYIYQIDVYIYIQRFDESMFKWGCKHDAFGQSSSKKGSITHKRWFHIFLVTCKTVPIQRFFFSQADWNHQVVPVYKYPTMLVNTETTILRYLCYGGVCSLQTNTDEHGWSRHTATPKVRSCCEYDSNQIYLVRNLRAMRCAKNQQCVDFVWIKKWPRYITVYLCIECGGCVVSICFLMCVFVLLKLTFGNPYWWCQVIAVVINACGI